MDLVALAVQVFKRFRRVLRGSDLRHPVLISAFWRSCRVGILSPGAHLAKTAATFLALTMVKVNGRVIVE
jgi:hypothetical protein